MSASSTPTLPPAYGWWLAIPLLFAALAGAQLTRYGFWHDEIYTLSFLHGVDAYLFVGSDLQLSSQHSLAWYQQLLRQDAYWPHFWRDIIHEGHPPLYFLLLKGWTLLWGTGERGLRSFSLLAATLTLLVAARVGGLISRRAAWLLPLLLACCPPFLYFALEARMYALYLLLAGLNLYWLLRLLRQPVASAAGLGWFVATGLALLYTHYYGVFWYGCLALVLAIRFARQRAWGALLVLALPGLVFLPWLPILQQQTVAHKVHWTDGYLGLLASVGQYAWGSAALLLAPQTLTRFEFAALGGLALLALVNLDVVHRRRLLTWGGTGALLVLLYGAGLIFLDALLNHHTIAVPRYYLPLQFVLLLGLVAASEWGRSRLVQAAVIGGVLLLFAKVQVQQFAGGREAKQMYREAAGYLAQHYPPNSVEVVITPNGPTTLGIAYYCPATFPVRTEPVGQICGEYSKAGVVVVEQNMGLPIEAKAQPCTAPPATSRLRHFVLVDLVDAR